MLEKKYEHVQYVDLHNDGTLREVIIMKYTENGDLYFIPVDDLDDIDVARLQRIINRKDADRYELWDLLSTVTLKNGVNALELYHQFVKHRTSNGKIHSPGKVISVNKVNRPTVMNKKDVSVRKGPGRPPKSA